MQVYFKNYQKRVRLKFIAIYIVVSVSPKTTSMKTNTPYLIVTSEYMNSMSIKCSSN